MTVETSATPRSKGTSGTHTPSWQMSPGSPKMTGAELYAAFMDTYHRRQKKPQPYYGNDAAGVTTEQRDKIKLFNTKGRGVTPPPDNYYAEYKPAKKFIPGKSFVSSEDLMTHSTTAPVNKSLDSAMLEATLQQIKKAGAGARPLSSYGLRQDGIKTSAKANASGMQGASLQVTSEGPQARASRRPGSAAPQLDTRSRVMVLSVAQPDTPASPTSPGSYTQYVTNLAKTNSPKESVLAGTWARHLYEAGMLSAPPSRPSTAPAKPFSPGMSEARQRYNEMATSNADIFAYRHSGGICPEEYKLDATRSPAPQLNAPSPDAAREAYYAARVNFATNRVNAILTAKPRYG